MIILGVAYLFKESAEAPTMAPTFDESWYEASSFSAADKESAVAKFGQSVSLNGELFVVGAPEAENESGDRVGTVSVFNIYAADAIYTVSVFCRYNIFFLFVLSFYNPFPYVNV